MALMNRSSSASRRPLERGQLSWVTLLLVTALGTGIYLGVVWAPIYIVHFEVKQTVRDYMNQAVKNRNDAHLVERMCQKIALLDSTVEVGEDGRKTRTPTVVLSPSDVTWERDTSATPPMLRVAFEYVRVVTYPLLDRTQEQVMTVDLSQDIEIPNWGPSR